MSQEDSNAYKALLHHVAEKHLRILKETLDEDDKLRSDFLKCDNIHDRWVEGLEISIKNELDYQEKLERKERQLDQEKMGLKEKLD